MEDGKPPKVRSLACYCVKAPVDDCPTHGKKQIEQSDSYISIVLEEDTLFRFHKGEKVDIGDKE